MTHKIEIPGKAISPSELQDFHKTYANRTLKADIARAVNTLLLRAYPGGATMTVEQIEQQIRHDRCNLTETVILEDIRDVYRRQGWSVHIVDGGILPATIVFDLKKEPAK